MRQLLLAALLLPGLASSQDMPVPQILDGIHGVKGRYRMEVLEGGGSRAGSRITVCTDNLLDPTGRDAKREQPCKYRLLKDNAEEAVVERVCGERTTNATVRRDGKSFLIDLAANGGARGAQNMKLRATHLGACREEQQPPSRQQN